MAKSLMHWLKSDVKLLKITEVDEFYRSNPFILSGYRDKITYFGCLKSVLVLHNETINIWTHLLGFLFFVGLFLRDILFLIPAKESGIEVADSDFFVLCSLIICYQVSLRLLFQGYTHCPMVPFISQIIIPLWFLDVWCIFVRQTTFHLEDCPKVMSFFVNPV